jgi:hypothetical protein
VDLRSHCSQSARCHAHSRGRKTATCPRRFQLTDFANEVV